MYLPDAVSCPMADVANMGKPQTRIAVRIVYRMSVPRHDAQINKQYDALLGLFRVARALLFSGLARKHPAMTTIYKICSNDLWNAFSRSGTFEGAPVDIADGFIHFSTASQLRETAAKHFSGQSDLVVFAVEDSSLGAKLKYEVSRGGALFPHLYRDLSFDEVAWMKPLPLQADGSHDFGQFEL